MNRVARPLCVLNGADDLEPLASFPSFPVFMGCTDRPAAEDVRADMNWFISRTTGIVQLNPLLPLDVLYAEGHGSGSIGAIWDEHHRSFARFVQEAGVAHVFEIGGGHGKLSMFAAELGVADWTILEPNPSPAAGCTARFVRGFFDAAFTHDAPFDAVVHSHVLEHIYEPDLFLQHLAAFMATGKHLIFSVPNMEIMLGRGYTNTLNFEHTLLLNAPFIDYLLAKNGFRVVRRATFREDHSLFFDAVRDPLVQKPSTPPCLYVQNRQLFSAFVDQHRERIDRLNEALSHDEGPVYLFGAHIFAQFLFAFGLDETRLVAVLDNDPKKQGRRLVGTSLAVKAPRVLAGLARPVVILKAGVYNDEIRNDILTNINPSARFWE
jgi:SAM-dependent methyltransferase